MAPVLVYGSLMRGFANHHWLRGARFLGEGVMAGLALYDLGPFPMAVPSGDRVLLHGEVYAVDHGQLAQLDLLEGTPRLYERQRHPLLAGGDAWVYVGRHAQVRHSPRLPTGRWRGPSRGRHTRPEPLPEALPEVQPE